MSEDPDLPRVTFPAGDAFREHRDTLLTAVTDVHILANSLYSKGLISREQLEHAQLPALTPNERKVKLFDAVEARLRSNPGDIDTLLDILDDDPLLQIFSKKIKSSYYPPIENIQTETATIFKHFVQLYPHTCKSTEYTDAIKSIFYVEKKMGMYQDESMENEKYNESDEGVEKKSPLSSVSRGISKAFEVDIRRMGMEYREETTENEECNESDESTEEKKGLLSGVRRGIRKLFGAARNMTASFIKSTLSVLKLDIKIFRKYKKRFDKHTDREQVRWWFEIWGDESALKALESKWEEVSAESKWRLEICLDRSQRC